MISYCKVRSILGEILDVLQCVWEQIFEEAGVIDKKKLTQSVNVDRKWRRKAYLIGARLDFFLFPTSKFVAALLLSSTDKLLLVNAKLCNSLIPHRQ